MEEYRKNVGVQNQAEIEIIDFFRPIGNGKNLFVSNIEVDLGEDIALSSIQENLHKAFSRFGPVYEIQIFPIPLSKLRRNDEISENKSHDFDEKETPPSRKSNPFTLKFYAFVKFYSMMNAKRAKSHLNMTLIIGVKPLKISFASRKKAEKREKLYVNNCFDLANYYLGFNGWSSSVLCLKRVEKDLDRSKFQGQECTCKFVCITEMKIHNHGLVTQGVSTVEESWSARDPLSKLSALTRCRKRCHQYALENAFAKLLLVVFGNGKIHVEIDTTQADPLQRLESLENLNLVSVNELEEEPKASSDEDETDQCLIDLTQQKDPSNIDEENVNILMELERE